MKKKIFKTEKEFETYIWKNLYKMTGFKPISRQFYFRYLKPNDIGSGKACRIDILAKNNGNLLIIEIKKKANKRTFDEIEYYANCFEKIFKIKPLKAIASIKSNDLNYSECLDKKVMYLYYK